MDKIELGQKVRCIVTGFQGIATGRIEYLNGCVQYCVRPRAVAKEGEPLKYPEGSWIDYQNLEVVGDGVRVEGSDTGGEEPAAPDYCG
jgi:hypothetical protein